MSTTFEDFLTNPDLNIYQFSLLTTLDHETKFKIEDFEFTLIETPNGYIFQTCDDILEEIATAVNGIHDKNPFEILTIISNEYGDIFEEHSPLYNNQDVFELENDNHDMKFVARVRFSEDDIHPDIFAKIFDFLDPIELTKLDLVCKRFQKLARMDVIWKKFCNSMVKNDEHRKFYLEVERFPQVHWIPISSPIKYVDELFCWEMNKYDLKYHTDPTCGRFFFTSEITSGSLDLIIEMNDILGRFPGYGEESDEENYPDPYVYPDFVIGIMNEMAYDHYFKDGLKSEYNECTCNGFLIPNCWALMENLYFASDDGIHLCYDGKKKILVHGSNIKMEEFQISKNWTRNIPIRLNLDEKMFSIDGNESIKIHGESFRLFVAKCAGSDWTKTISLKIKKMNK